MPKARPSPRQKSGRGRKQGSAHGQKPATREPPKKDEENEAHGEQQTSGNQPLAFERLEHLDYDHEALIARGILSDTAAHFGIGYAARGIMRGRIAIPIHNAAGQLLAYAGADPQDPQKSYRWPKGFRRELELYNMHRAAASEDLSENGLIVVADFFDVFACFENGLDNVVALMGTTVSAEQLALIEALLAHTDTRCMVFARSDNDEPPWETIGHLATVGWVRARVLAEILSY